MVDYRFEDQRPDEEIIFVTKRHPWVLARFGLATIISVILLVLSYSFFGFSRVTIILLLLIILSLAFYGFLQWFIYNNYLYILSNQRIIVIEQHGFFSRRVVEAELDKIQNVSIEVKGAMKTLINFGDILMRTAGMEPVIVLKNIDNPYQVQQKIIKYCKKISDIEKKEQN